MLAKTKPYYQLQVLQTFVSCLTLPLPIPSDEKKIT